MPKNNGQHIRVFLLVKGFCLFLSFFLPSGCSHYIRLSTSLTQRDFKIGDIKIQRAEAKVIEIQHHADNWIITLMKFLHWLKVRVRPSLILKSLSQTWKCVRTGASFLHLCMASWRNLLQTFSSCHLSFSNMTAMANLSAWDILYFLVFHFTTIFYICILYVLMWPLHAATYKT